MVRRVLLLSLMTIALGGCSEPEPTPTATSEPPTATAEPTAEPTVETMSKAEYAEAAYAQFKRSADSQTEAIKLLRDPKWVTDATAREELLAVMAIPDEVLGIFKATVPPAGTESVHAGMVEQASYLATSMGKLGDAMTAVEAGDTATATEAMKSHQALLEAATATTTETLTALGALRAAP